MGLRERKKQRTRLALIDAALDLFLGQGYEATTIDQIAASVDVSPRTFFRYFGSKEDVVLAMHADTQDILLAELADRPDTEAPFEALTQAMRITLAAVTEGDEAHRERLVKTMRLIGDNPLFTAGQMRLITDSEQRLVAEISRRRGVDDLRSHFVVAVFTAAVRVASEFCLPGEVRDPAVLAARLEETLAVAEKALCPGWDR
ncbi:TetR/AcrR family transcriptional regulator [Acrocarpospora catenulata]|uniref:TetR/AcrR family transcriptional regulator n=1 Tax=Acrocarpospora catenulata TaxID=2836182 RepID=UPI001BD9C16D|nr:TetR family transcriptional regulator [Acrocarpospora catenulata]